MALDDGVLGRLTPRLMVRAIVWLIVAAAVGWAGAALILYGFGIVLAPLMFAVLVYLGWRHRGVSFGVTGFGIGFSGFMIPFLVRNLAFLRDPALVALAVAGIVLGPIIAVIGILGWLGVFSRPGRSNGPPLERTDGR